MNLIDKAVATLSPVKGLERMAARKQLEILNTGYSNSGANKIKKAFRGWFFKGGSVKEDIEDNLETLTQRSRDLYMNTPIATGSLKSIRTNVIGSGLVLNSQIDHEFLGLSEEEGDAWETQVEREFNLWAESLMADAMQMHNFYELQQIAFLSFLVSGEVFTVLPYRTNHEHCYSLRVQLIESDRVSQPAGNHKHIFSGVELGKYGEVVAYHICDVHPLSTSSGQRKWQRIEKFGEKTRRQNVLHLMESERPEQRRGVPILAPVIESLKQLDRYSEAELTAALVSSLMTVFIQTSEDDDGEGMPIGEGIPEGEQIDTDDPTSIELAPGSVIALAPGETANTSNPARNNASFDPFTTAVLRQVGAAIELPYEVLVKHFMSSYSASRASLLEAWKMFKMRRHFMATRFCQPIYEEWLTEAVLLGRIHAPGFLEDPLIRKAYAQAEWNGPSQGQLDPLKEVNAAIKRVEAGFSTRARETAEMTGGDYWRNHNQRVREETARREARLDIAYLEVMKAMGAEKEVNEENGED